MRLATVTIPALIFLQNALIVGIIIDFGRGLSRVMNITDHY